MASASRSRAANFWTRRCSTRIVPKRGLRQVRSMQAHDGIRRRAEPPARRRSRDAAIRGKAEFARALDEFPEPMVIALLRADYGAHAVIIATRSAPKANVVPGSPGDNSRRGVRNVLAHSTAGSLAAGWTCGRPRPRAGVAPCRDRPVAARR